MNIKLKNGMTVIVPAIDGQCPLKLLSDTPTKDIIFDWPASPFRASQINIETNNDITGIKHIGTMLENPFTAIKANGSAGVVFCPVEQKFMCTGFNIGTGNAKKSMNYWLIVVPMALAIIASIAYIYFK